jgi:hypothetical protein
MRAGHDKRNRFGRFTNVDRGSSCLGHHAESPIARIGNRDCDLEGCGAIDDGVEVLHHHWGVVFARGVRGDDMQAKPIGEGCAGMSHGPEGLDSELTRRRRSLPKLGTISQFDLRRGERLIDHTEKALRRAHQQLLARPVVKGTDGERHFYLLHRDDTLAVVAEQGVSRA